MRGGGIMINNPLPELMTVKELQEYLQCSPNVAYSTVHQKNFPSLKIGGQFFVVKDKLPEWIERQCKKLAL